jgi:hypothetical protein
VSERRRRFRIVDWTHTCRHASPTIAHSPPLNCEWHIPHRSTVSPSRDKVSFVAPSCVILRRSASTCSGREDDDDMLGLMLGGYGIATDIGRRCSTRSGEVPIVPPCLPRGRSISQSGLFRPMNMSSSGRVYTDRNT